MGEGEGKYLTLSSIDSSSKGFMLCFTPAVSIAVWDLLTRGLTCFCQPRCSFSSSFVGFLEQNGQLSW